jgi:hypothetical protein
MQANEKTQLEKLSSIKRAYGDIHIYVLEIQQDCEQ